MLSASFGIEGVGLNVVEEGVAIMLTYARGSGMLAEADDDRRIYGKKKKCIQE